KALNRTDLDAHLGPEGKQQLSEALHSLRQAIDDGRLNINVNGEFKNTIERLGSSTDFDKLKGDFAELRHAGHVVDNVKLAPGTSVVLSVKSNQDLSSAGLPKIEVDRVEADVYYKTADGVVHIDEAKLAPNTFTSKLDKSIKASEGKKDPEQFGRYKEWIENGETFGDPRKVNVSINNTGPAFSELLNNKRLTGIEDFMSKDTSQPVIKVGDRFFSVDDLRAMDKHATDIVGKVKDQYVENFKAANNGAEPTPKQIREEILRVVKENFGTMEQALETLKKDNGAEYGKVVRPAETPATDATTSRSIDTETTSTRSTQSENIRSMRNSALIGGGVSLVTSTAQALQDGKIDGREALNIAGQTAVGAGSGVASDVIERSVANRLASRLGASTTSSVTSSATANTVRSLASRAGGAGVAGAAVNSAFAIVDQVGAYKRGEVTASRAIGNVTGEAAVGFGAGVAGMAAGAAIGSVIPVAGTAVGAVVGFGVGLVAGYVADKGLRFAGVDKAISDGVTAAIDLGAKGIKAVADVGRQVVDGTKKVAQAAVQKVTENVRAVASSASQAARAAYNYAGQKINQVSQATRAAVNYVAQKGNEVKQAVTQTVSNVANTARTTVSNVANAVGNKVNQAASSVGNFFSGASRSLKSVFGF
ncbi:MAG: hypothetical protein JNN15_03970, partial [Blastocatellia bacterium]|nr:hypothetical protein [Blastocatellia bacterium]